MSMRARRRARPWRAFAITLAALLLAAACGGGNKTSYDVSVAFNDRYTDAAGQAVEDAVHAYDAKADVLLQETFPPIARATVHTNDAAFCDDLRQRLQPRDDIAAITCRES